MGITISSGYIFASGRESCLTHSMAKPEILFSVWFRSRSLLPAGRIDLSAVARGYIVSGFALAVP
jgi:hypothetical protein